MALTETRPDTPTLPVAVAPEAQAGGLERLIGTANHLTTGRTFIVAAFLFGTISAFGLAFAALDTATDNGVLGDSAALVSNSSILGLILGGALPLLIGLGIYLVPLQIGSPAVSFPRAAALSLWTWLVGVLIFAISVAVDGGVGGADQDAARLGNLAVGLMLTALLGAGVCVVTTVVSHRPLGMSLARVPLFSWSMLIAVPAWILNGSAVLAGVVLGHVSRSNAAGLADNYELMIAGIWRAPAVYMLAIPVLGIAGDVTAKVAGRRITAYGMAQGLIAAFGVFSFGVWTVADRATAISAWDRNPVPSQTIVFAVWVLIPGLATLALLGLYADTIRRSKLSVSAAGVAGPLSLLLVLGGVLTAAFQVLDTIGKGNLVGFDTPQFGISQTFFLVAAAVCGAVGGTAFWGEKLWGHSSDALARPAVGLLFVGGGLLGTVAALQGVLGAGTSLSAGVYGGLLAAAAGIFALGFLTGLVSAVKAAGAGHSDPVADDQDGLTLEWAVSSPPVASNESPAVPAINSPYPLLDLREGPATSEESK